jgi:hypothetical protein
VRGFKFALMCWMGALVLIVASSGVTAAAQRRTGQMRPSPTAPPSPDPPKAPAGASRFRDRMVFRPGPVAPAPGLAFRRLRLPVFPLVWGWGTMPFYYDDVGPALTLEDGPTGGVQLDVQPWRAAVFVDGVHVGRVEEFKGYYQHLEVVAGPHQITIVESGYQPLVLHVVVVPGKTTTYRATLPQQ